MSKVKQCIKRKSFVIVMAIIVFAMCTIITGYCIAFAEESDLPLTQSEAPIAVQAYKLEDNKGYHASEDKLVTDGSHPLQKNLINLSVYTESDFAESKIDQGAVSGYNGYGITGNSAAIQLSYNFDNPNEIKGADGYSYAISSDTAQSVGSFENIGVVGTGALLFQKKLNATDNWEWQTKDGETKKQLHTFNFTDTVRLEHYGGETKYTLYTPSGEDLSKGVFIKITFAYELKYDVTWKEKNWLGIWKTKTETRYINMLETSEFYVVQNSGKVLFHNASNFDNVGEEDSSGAITIDKFETLLSGDVTLNGFRLDTLGVEAYDISYKHNGGEEQSATNGQFFLAHGRYDFTIKRKIGSDIPYTIFVDRREVNDAIVGYFGQSLFTPDSQRVYTTGQYPAYLAGAATWNLNATDGTVLPVVGKLFKVNEEGEEELVRRIEQPYGDDYKTEALQGTIDEVGIYKAEFWGNPKYLDDTEISGDLYHFIFTFEIVDKETPTEPSINEAYLNGLVGFSDMQSRYYAVSLPTAGAGKAIYAFADYGGAYDFAYKLEREKVKEKNGKYEYNGKWYTSQKDVLAAVDAAADKVVHVRYFDATDPESYQTADIADENILNLNFTKDVIVFTGDNEQSYMQAGLPSLNGRKFRYINPESDTPEEGTLYFAFLHIAGFESDKVTLTHKETNAVFDILYDVSVEYQLGLQHAPSGIYTVREENSFGEFSEYEAVYLSPGDMTGSATVSLFRNGAFTEKTFSKSNTSTETNVNGFILNSAANELDPYSIVKITKDGQTKTYTFGEVSDLWFAEGGVYDFVLSDRLGNTVSFTIIITAPVGYADIRLELEQEDGTISTDFRAFVGQEIELPIPTLTSELFVFDGWLYNDTLITDYKFTPGVAGSLHIWQQITQKYTYLNFDSNGGEAVERLKVAIGDPIKLPTASKTGWMFGGWEYGGNVYSGTYVPTSASPTFTAIWNFEETTIELYDGNLYDKIIAKAGDKVSLPFPARTGYTFLGWKEEQANGAIKIYYGQITELANNKSMRLDALWIREGNVDANNLDGGTGGRTMIHFVDGTLLMYDSLQGMAGTSISTPKPTRAGFVFMGWIWRTTPIAGKIYPGDTMVIPSSTGDKIILEALWSAKAASGTTVGGTLQSGDNGGILGGIKGFLDNEANSIACLPAIFCLLLAYCAFRARKKNNLFKQIKPYQFVMKQVRRQVFVQASPLPQSVCMQACAESGACQYHSFATKTKNKRRKFSYFAQYGRITIFTALLLTVVLSIVCAFGNWDRLGAFQTLANRVEPAAQTAGLNNESSNLIGGNLQVDSMPKKEEVKEKLNEVMNAGENGNLTDELDLTEEEMFIYSIIMIDLYSLGYLVFPAEVILPNQEIVLGFGYTNYEEAYNEAETSDTVLYFGAGFVALPRQTEISQADIETGIKISHSYEKTEEEQPIETESEQENAYILSFTESYGPCHYIVDGQYVVYSIEKTNLRYTSIPENEAVFNPEYGSAYSYDDGRIVFDPDLGKKTKITSTSTATSINTLLDPVIAKSEYDRYIAEQTANGFTVDTMNFVYISYESLDAYFLSEQDESLLGIDVQEFYDMERTVGPNEYYTVDADGNLTKLEFPPMEEEKASWLDRLAGAVLAIGMVCVGVIIVAAVSVVSCGAASAAAPYIMGAFIGGGVEVFMQTVIQGKKVTDINWLRVGIAAVSGAVAAIPGIGWFGAGLLQGVTEAALTAADGGSLQDVLAAFTVGFITGVVIHGVGKAVSKMKFCFVAGTGVLMAGGAIKAIENIRVGDTVKSYNAKTGKTENKRVLQTFENKTSELVTVTTSDGQQVTATPGHKFYANNAWVSAENLRAGDVLVNVNGQKVIVEQTQHEILESPVKVYNFEVADNHTYFVGSESGIAVHNVGCEKGAYKFKVKTKNGTEAWYVGKATGNRNNVSLSEKSLYYDVIEGSNVFEKCDDDVAAFIKEAEWMNELADQGQKLLNKIASPGFKKGGIEFVNKFRDALSGKWFK